MESSKLWTELNYIFPIPNGLFSEIKTALITLVNKLLETRWVCITLLLLDPLADCNIVDNNILLYYLRELVLGEHWFTMIPIILLSHDQELLSDIWLLIRIPACFCLFPITLKPFQILELENQTRLDVLFLMWLHFSWKSRFTL